MMTTNKKDVIKKVIFKSPDLKINEEFEGVYTFDISSCLYTTDVLEATAYLIKNKRLESDKFWDLELKDNMIHYIIPTSSLYWLSGGDKFWNGSNFQWVENYELYEKKFQLKLYEIYQSSKTIRDLKEKLIKNFNIDVFYEFALFTKLKKEKS